MQVFYILKQWLKIYPPIHPHISTKKETTCDPSNLNVYSLAFFRESLLIHATLLLPKKGETSADKLCPK